MPINNINPNCHAFFFLEIASLFSIFYSGLLISDYFFFWLFPKREKNEDERRPKKRGHTQGKETLKEGVRAPPLRDRRGS